MVNKVGLIVAQFTIDTTGTIREIKIIRGIDKIADNELIRIIKMMPPWKPGEQLNKKVKVFMNLPLRLPYENKNCR
jgi:protein TonB